MGDRYRCEIPRSSRYGTSSAARSKPKSFVSWRRYVARTTANRRSAVAVAQQQERMRCEVHAVTTQGARISRRVDQRRPSSEAVDLRQDEVARARPAVHEQEDRAPDDRTTARVDLVRRFAVQQHADRLVRGVA